MNILSFINMDHKDFLIYSFLLVGILNTAFSVKWSLFHNGCETSYGRIAYFSNLHLSHCSAECNVNDKCKVFGYSSPDKRCFLFDESFSTSTTESCSSKTVSFYKDSCGNASNYNYVTSLNKCIRYQSSPRLFWDDAREVCEKEGAHLIYVKTKDVLEYIIGFKEANNTKIWIGGKQSKIGSKTFEWTSGETIDRTNGGQFWFEGRPAVNDPSDNFCLQAKKVSDQTFGFYERTCETARNFFCELDVF